MLDVEFTQLSDTGRTRNHNEDYLGYVLPYTPAQLRSHGCVFALADGVGGQEKGEGASQLAVEILLAGFSAAKSGESHKALLSRLVQSANLKVYEQGQGAHSSAGRATTIVATALQTPPAPTPPAAPPPPPPRARHPPPPDSPRPLHRRRTGAHGDPLRQRGRQLFPPPLAQPLGRQRPGRQRGDRRSPGAEERHTAAVLRRPAQLGAAGRHCRRGQPRRQPARRGRAARRPPQRTRRRRTKHSPKP